MGKEILVYRGERENIRDGENGTSSKDPEKARCVVWLAKGGIGFREARSKFLRHSPLMCPQQVT